MKDKFLKIIKNQKVIIALCVFALTTITIGVSYSAFFTVKTNTNNQVVTTGTLQVTYGEGTQSITKPNMRALPDSEGLKDGETSTIYIQNTGTLDANYTLAIGYDMDSFTKRKDYKNTDRLTPLEYVMVAVYEYSPTKGDTLIVAPISLADLTVYNGELVDGHYNSYSLLYGSLDTESNRTKTYKVKMWLSENANSYASNTYFYIKSEIIAEADETKNEYNFHCRLVNENYGAISNVKVSIQNGSYVTTTNENGEFEITNLLPGTYNVDIIGYENNYKTNLTIREGTANSTSIVPYDSLLGDVGGMRLDLAAYFQGTSVNALKRNNSITTTTDTFTFKSNVVYNNANGFIITGGSSEFGGNLLFRLDSNVALSSLTLE